MHQEPFGFHPWTDFLFLRRDSMSPIMPLLTDSVTAGNILADCVVNSIRNYGRLTSFRSTVITALTHPTTTAVLHRQASTIPEALRQYLPDPPPHGSPIYTTEGRNALAQEVVQVNLTTAADAINAASFIFVHSMLDDAATQCCQVASLMDPESFRRDLAKKPIELSEFEGTTFETVFNEMLKQFVFNIGKREGLVDRIRRVLRSGRPTSGTVSIIEAPYRFDEDRIQELDRIRHAVVHGARNIPVNRNVDDDLLHMHQTAHFLTNSLISRFFLSPGFHSLLVQRFQSSVTNVSE
jgi:hypothetical protein